MRPNDTSSLYICSEKVTKVSLILAFLTNGSAKMGVLIYLNGCGNGVLQKKTAVPGCSVTKISTN